jgi:hypothetical protein
MNVGPVEDPRFGGAINASHCDDRSRYREVKHGRSRKWLVLREMVIRTVTPQLV